MIIAGTGHRPNKLGGYSDAAFQKLVTVCRIGLNEAQPDKVITGMALGYDQALATAAHNLGIPFAAYVPVEGQDSVWLYTSKLLYRSLLKKACEVKIICKGPYSAAAMQKRNEAMVDDADEVLACWDGTAGGTGNCIAYAEKKGKIITNIYDKWLEMV